MRYIGEAETLGVNMISLGALAGSLTCSCPSNSDTLVGLQSDSLVANSEGTAFIFFWRHHESLVSGSFLALLKTDVRGERSGFDSLSYSLTKDEVQ